MHAGSVYKPLQGLILQETSQGNKEWGIWWKHVLAGKGEDKKSSQILRGKSYDSCYEGTFLNEKFKVQNKCTFASSHV